MAYPDASLIVWFLGFIQMFALVSAWLARLNEGSRNQASWHGLFLALLAVMGLVTMATVPLGPPYWLPSGATLAIMVLAAIWDFGPAAEYESL